MKLLYTTPELEYPPKGGPRLRVDNSIKALASVGEVILVSRRSIEQIGGEPAVEHYQKYCSNIYFLTDGDSQIAAEQINKIALMECAEVIWMGFGNISYEIRLQMIKQQCPFRIVMDTDAVWSRFVLRGLSYAENLQQKMKVFAQGILKRWEESWGTSLSHVTTAVSEVDAMYYRLFNQTPYAVDLFSNVIDPASYAAEYPNPSIQKPCVYLAGTFWPGSPMEQAAVWFLRDILPIVRRSYPHIHVYIIGTGITEPVKNLADRNVTIAGRVESVLPYLKNADVALVPLMFESGTRFKIMEAGICSIPCVSTTLGAEGIPVTHGRDILIADGGEDFARAIVYLLDNPVQAKRIAEHCKVLIQRNYSIDSAVLEACSILSNLLRFQSVPVYSLDNALDTIASKVYPAMAAGDVYAMFAYAVLIFGAMLSKYGNTPPFILEEEKEQINELLQHVSSRVSDHTNIRRALALLNSHNMSLVQ